MIDNMGNVFLPYCSTPVLDESVGERSVFYRLGESELFEYANKNTGVNGVKLIDIIPRMTVPGHGFVQLGLNQLDKTTKFELFDSARFKLSCKANMLKMLDAGQVVMVYSEEFRIPTCIPYVVQTDGKTSAKIFVNVSDFGEMNQYGMFEISQARNYNAVMALLFSACASYRIVTSQSALPADLADGMILMYAGMFEKVINSLVHMDPVTKDKIRYLATEFALIQMYGTKDGTDRFYRYKQKYFPKLSKMITDTIDNQFNLDHFDKLSLFIDELKKNYPSMKGLSMYLVYDKWVRTFGAATAMSIDYLGYHLYTICMVLLESPLITRVALEPILEKNRGLDVYKRIQQMI